ncbi:MAG: hypothetical protein SF162_15760 [bacterium]|nr:hypothetical protein [bacterium]
MTLTPSTWLTPRRITFAVLLGFALVLWLPTGFNGGLTGDAWAYFAFADQGNIPSFAERPMLPLAWWAAYALSPGLATGINIVALLLLFGKAACAALIGFRLELPPALCFAVGALTLVFPADTGTFYLGALAIHCAAFCYFLAVYLLIVYWQSRRITTLVMMTAALFISVNIYEITLVLSLITPLILLFFQRKIDWPLIRTALLWYEVPLLRIALTVWLITNTRAFGYQSGLFDPNWTIGGIVEAVGTIYARHLVTAWVVPQGEVSALAFGLAGLAGLVGAWVIGRLATAPRTDLPVMDRRAILIALVCLALIGLGTSLYLITRDRLSSLRTYYYSAVGAAGVIALVLWAVSRRSPRYANALFAAGIGVLVGLGTLRLLEQHTRYFAFAREIQTLPLKIAEVLPTIQPGTAILITGDFADDALRRPIPSTWWYFQPVVHSLYADRSLAFAYCYPDQPAPWGTDQEQCAFQQTRVQVSIYNGTVRLVDHPYEQVIVLRHDGDRLEIVTDLAPYVGREVSAYQPEQRYSTAGSPPRLGSLFVP